eukprot:m.136775 g.136775  ORF g.136775 m.136775 type:complete len:270 (+) comp22646_c0_seq2:1622-2431(+)
MDDVIPMDEEEGWGFADLSKSGDDDEAYTLRTRLPDPVRAAVSTPPPTPPPGTHPPSVTPPKRAQKRTQKSYFGLPDNRIDYIRKLLLPVVTEHDIPDHTGLMHFLDQHPEILARINEVCDSEDLTKIFSRIRKNKNDREKKNPGAPPWTVRKELQKIRTTQFWLLIYTARLEDAAARIEERSSCVEGEWDNALAGLEAIQDKITTLGINRGITYDDLLAAMDDVKPEPIHPVVRSTPGPSPARTPSPTTTAAPIRRSQRNMAGKSLRH